MPVGFVCEIWTKKIPEAGLNSPVPSSVNKKYFFLTVEHSFSLFKLCVTTEDPRKSKPIIFLIFFVKIKSCFEYSAKEPGSFTCACWIFQRARCDPEEDNEVRRTRVEVAPSPPPAPPQTPGKNPWMKY